jgi:hypothetical protein
MLYVLRLTNGDCFVTLAADEQSARQIAVLTLDPSIEIVTVRPLASFLVQLTPTGDGNLEISQWDDAALDNILANEYPILHQAYLRANSQPFLEAFDSEEPLFSQLHAANDRNTEIIREGLRREREKFNREEHPLKADDERSPREPVHARSAASSNKIS